VYEAEDAATGRRVALKAVFAGRKGLTPEQRAVLAGEARLLRLVDHPNIVRCLGVVDTGRSDGSGGVITGTSSSGSGRVGGNSKSGSGRGLGSSSSGCSSGNGGRSSNGGSTVVIITEKLSGGELLRGLGALQRYSEADAAGVFAQVMAAVAYLHGLGIMHRCAREGGGWLRHCVYVVCMCTDQFSCPQMF
jgi:serine/threonine protein kinase